MNSQCDEPKTAPTNGQSTNNPPLATWRNSAAESLFPAINRPPIAHLILSNP